MKPSSPPNSKPTPPLRTQHSALRTLKLASSTSPSPPTSSPPQTPPSPPTTPPPPPSPPQPPPPPPPPPSPPPPPQIISLADLSITINNSPADSITLRDSSLVWTGHLPPTPTPIEITYTAVGKGLYVLQTPPGKILDTFDLQLTANGSDIRMLELSLQPHNVSRTAAQTKYTWNYKRLAFGRPIQLDVLGIAPIDRLGEIRWLGPLSVIAFGIL